MKCPKCNSENVQIQSKEYKPKITLPCCLTVGGLGLVFLGVLGLIIGVLLGLLISAILYAIIPTGYQAVMVCQQCGFVGTSETIAHNPTNPLYCTMEESNVAIVRKSNSIGSVCKMEIQVDNFPPFNLLDGDVKYLKVENGVHRVSYRQINGMGKKQRNGSLNIKVDNRHVIRFMMLPRGIEVSVNDVK